mgnify:CR=1 FL=1
MTKIAVLILGFLAEKELNPYEIIKILKKIDIHRWFPIAESSVYAAVKTLQKKGYIEGKIARDGEMPAKTVYKITETGKSLFLKELQNYLITEEKTPRQFSIGIMLLNHISKSDVIRDLGEKLSALTGKFEFLQNLIHTFEKTKHIPYTGIMHMKYSLYLIEAEIKVTDELIGHIEKDNNWNNFIVKDIYKNEG